VTGKIKAGAAATEAMGSPADAALGAGFALDGTRRAPSQIATIENSTAATIGVRLDAVGFKMTVSIEAAGVAPSPRPAITDNERAQLVSSSSLARPHVLSATRSSSPRIHSALGKRSDAAAESARSTNSTMGSGVSGRATASDYTSPARSRASASLGSSSS
jgi:hypothetical protein